MLQQKVMVLQKFVIFVLLEGLLIATAQDFQPRNHSKSLPSIRNVAVKSEEFEKLVSNDSKSITKELQQEPCPSLENADLLTDEEFFEHLVNTCRYDRIQRPRQHDENGNDLPVNVYVRSFIYYLQNLDSHELQFKMQTLLQLRYYDHRLKFKIVAPNRKHPIKGEEDLRKKIWVPHVFFSNERDSGVLGTYGHHILTSISPDGTVIISSRLHATLFCPMDLRKFPFDSQECRAALECWMYNASQVQLHWEEKTPLTMGPDKILTEYILRNTSTHESMIVADERDLRHGAFIGNYSSITFNFKVDRQAGFYVLEYFLPSALIVAISWVSFYLQADQTAPRAMLGATSMLSFITLSSAQNKILPKVSYIKALEVWSMACTAFIFMSLVEFAFVNVIWRRKKHVELKKVNAANILKHTLTAKQVRMALGIGTSRSVVNIPPEIKEVEEFHFDKLKPDKRQSIDIIRRNSINENEFMKSNGLNRSSSCTNLEKFRKNRVFSFEGNKSITNESQNGYNHNNSFSEQICDKKSNFENNIALCGNNHHHMHNVDKKTKFDLSEIESEENQTKIHRDSFAKVKKFDDLEHLRRKSIMIPVILTEDENGKYQVEMDSSKVIANKDNSVEILIEDESDDSTYNIDSRKNSEELKESHNRLSLNHHLIYDGWTRMTPHEISHWIDKRSRIFFPFAFAVFNVFYWTFVYLF